MPSSITIFGNRYRNPPAAEFYVYPIYRLKPLIINMNQLIIEDNYVVNSTSNIKLDTFSSKL